MNAIEIQDLRIRYGAREAVSGLSFTVPEGAVFGLIGPNGAGKSSTLRVLATLTTPQGGSARVCGHDVVRAPHAVRKAIGWMPDVIGVYDDLTAAEYLHFFAAAHGIERGKRDGLVADLLQLVDLPGHRDAIVTELSRGMQQRLQVARVLLHDPKVLLLDEPAEGLDPRARVELRELLRELVSMGKTVVISSHILHELGLLCTRAAIVEAGRLVAEGTPADLLRQAGLRRVVHVEVGGGADALAARLQAQAGVTAVRREGDRLAIELDEDRLGVEDLHAAVAAGGTRVRMFQPEALDLETAFLKLTQGKVA